MSDLRCPYCGGEIDELTVICRHCKKNVRKATQKAINETAQVAAQTTQVNGQVRQLRAPMWVVWAILGLAVVVVIWSSSGGRSSSGKATPTMATRAGLRGAVEMALGEGNRDVERISGFDSSGAAGQVYVRFAINDNFSAEMITGGAQMDCTSILKAIAKSDASYGSVRIVGTFPMKDAFGNVEEAEVMRLEFQAATVKKINWSGFSYKDVYTIADSAEVRAQFRP